MTFESIQRLEPRRLLATAHATIETDPVHHDGDSADDVAIWVHPTDPSLSTVIGTDKDSDGGLLVYDLAGNELGFFADGKMNNVDVRYGIELGGKTVDIVVASNRTAGGSLAVYKVNPTTRLLENVAARTLETEMDGNVYGATLYHSAAGKLYAFLSSRNGGDIEQWELFDSGNGKIDGKIVREFHVGSTTEAMVIDDETATLYVGEESEAIWKYGADPDDGSARTQIDSTGSGGHLDADIEGLAIYEAANGKGYLIASSQGSNDFTVYERDGNHAYLGRFDIGSGEVDAVTTTDGIEVTSFGLGNAFGQGLFVAQDGSNGSANQNFKLVPWERIAEALDLVIDTTQDPRSPGDAEPPPPSSSAASIKGRTLVINGTGGNDQILVFSDLEEQDGVAVGFNDDAVVHFDYDDFDQIRITGAGGDDLILVDQRQSEVTRSSRIYGNAGADSISGGEAADRIFGGKGHDLIHGNGGADTLRGQSGHDTLLGGRGIDALFGNSGIDALAGGKGKDQELGGKGADEQARPSDFPLDDLFDLIL